MADSFKDDTCAKFAEDLGAKLSVPGGGAASAYVAALGAALAQMVGNFTIGKLAYSDVEDDVRRLCAEAEDIRLRLLELMDEDARAFEPLSAAYAVDKDDPSREEVMEAALKGAIATPLSIMRECCKAIDVLAEMREIGARMLQSDVGCGAAICRGALEAAAMNVFVNTGMLKDAEFADATNAECDEMLGTYESRAVAIEESVARELRGA